MSKNHITREVLQWLVAVYNHHPQGMLIPGTCGELQILLSMKLVERCPVDAVRLTESGEVLLIEMMSLLKNHDE
jgi:hypothetical protein